MIGKSKMTRLGMALLTAGSIYLVGTSQALAKTVVVRPGDRVVYRGNYDKWRDRDYYRRYDWSPPARLGGPPPWAASWYRSRYWKDDRRDDWRDYWRRHRGERD